MGSIFKHKKFKACTKFRMLKNSFSGQIGYPKECQCLDLVSLGSSIHAINITVHESTLELFALELILPGLLFKCEEFKPQRLACQPRDAPSGSL